MPISVKVQKYKSTNIIENSMNIIQFIFIYSKVFLKMFLKMLLAWRDSAAKEEKKK